MFYLKNMYLILIPILPIKFVNNRFLSQINSITNIWRLCVHNYPPMYHVFYFCLIFMSCVAQKSFEDCAKSYRHAAKLAHCIQIFDLPSTHAVVQRDGNSWELKTRLPRGFKILPRDFLRKEILDTIKIFMCLHHWQQYTA